MELLKRFLILSVAIISGLASKAQNQTANPYPDYLEEVYLDMNFDQNLVTPEVPQQLHASVAAAMRTTAEQFQSHLPEALKKVIRVDLTRGGEVLIVTYPSEELFNPNDTLLSRYADKALQAILPLMKDPYMYKVMFAVNSDDTGSESYRDNLTEARQYSIYDWFFRNFDNGKIPEDIVVIPQGLGSTRPLPGIDFLTRDNRRKNRRVEFYFIPGPKLIEMVTPK